MTDEQSHTLLELLNDTLTLQARIRPSHEFLVSSMSMVLRMANSIKNPIIHLVPSAIEPSLRKPIHDRVYQIVGGGVLDDRDLRTLVPMVSVILTNEYLGISRELSFQADPDNPGTLGKAVCGESECLVGVNYTKYLDWVEHHVIALPNAMSSPAKRALREIRVVWEATQKETRLTNILEEIKEVSEQRCRGEIP